MPDLTRRSALRSAIAVALAPTLGSLLLPRLASTASAAVSWTAKWIWAPSSSTNQWVAFRRSLTLGAAPTKAVTRIAADSKYWLWVNGTLVVFEGGLKRGPNRTDTYYDEIDLAPYLRSGGNTVALLVWYFGKQGFSHNSSGKGGLLFQSDIEAGFDHHPAGQRHRLEAPSPPRLLEQHQRYAGQLPVARVQCALRRPCRRCHVRLAVARFRRQRLDRADRLRRRGRRALERPRRAPDPAVPLLRPEDVHQRLVAADHGARIHRDLGHAAVEHPGDAVPEGGRTGRSRDRHPDRPLRRRRGPDRDRARHAVQHARHLHLRRMGCRSSSRWRG